MRHFARFTLLGTLLVAPALAVQGPISINGDGPELSAFVLGFSDGGSCSVIMQGQVTTDVGGGNDTFDLRITDEGAVIASQTFSLPADGGVYPVATTFHLQHIFVNDDYGVTIDDPGGVGLFEFPDFIPIGGCTIQNIPTLSTAGVAGFGLLLAGAAAAVLVRRRRS